MSFTASPAAAHDPRGRHRANQRPHPRGLFVKLVAVAALLVGAFVPTVAAQLVSTAAVNLLANPSFEEGIAPWGGTHLQRRMLSAAPSGQWVVQATASNGQVTVDDWPGEVRSVAGGNYQGRMSLAASSSSAVGKLVTLVVREHTAAGSWVASWQTNAVLSQSFQQLAVQGTAVRSGDYIDIYAYQHSVAAGDALLADAAWLSGPSSSSAPAPASSSAPSTTLPSPAQTPSTTSAPGPATSAPGTTTTSAAPTSTSASPTPTSSTPTASSSNGPSIAELSLNSNQAGALGDTSKYRYVILQDYMYSHVAAIKKANPNTKVLAYLEAPVTYAQSCSSSNPPAYAPHNSFGVNYCYASQNHPEWFLTNSSGQRQTYPDYPSYSMMDVGNAAYQKTWAANAVAAAKADGFDGIYMDDVNTHPGHGLDGKVTKYTDQAYGQTMVNFVATVADQLRSQGLLAFANVSADAWVTWERSDALAMAAHLTGVDREHYSRWGDICGPFSENFNTTANNGTPPIATELSYDEAIQATGAYLMGIDYGYTPSTSTDVATMSYGRAMFLLAWDGRPGSTYIFRPCGGVDPANSAWMSNLGSPVGAMTQLSSGVYERKYSAGLVLLNPSRTTSASVTIPSGYATTGTSTLGPETARLIPTN
jgi:hypothetical protein